MDLAGTAKDEEKELFKGGAIRELFKEDALRELFEGDDLRDFCFAFHNLGCYYNTNNTHGDSKIATPIHIFLLSITGSQFMQRFSKCASCQLWYMRISFCQLSLLPLLSRSSYLQYLSGQEQ